MGESSNKSVAPGQNELSRRHALGAEPTGVRLSVTNLLPLQFDTGELCLLIRVKNVWSSWSQGLLMYQSPEIQLSLSELTKRKHDSRSWKRLNSKIYTWRTIIDTGLRLLAHTMLYPLSEFYLLVLRRQLIEFFMTNFKVF